MALDPTTPIRILSRNDIPSRWYNANPILGKGELAFETNQAGKVQGLKVGNGVTDWRNLEYLTVPVNAFQPRTEGFKLNAISNTIVLTERAQYILYVAIDGVIVLPDTNIPDTDYVIQPDNKTIIFTTPKPIGSEILIVYVVDGLDLDNLRVLDQGFITFDIEPGTVIQRYTYALPYKFILNYGLAIGNPTIQVRRNNVVIDYNTPTTVEVGDVLDFYLSSTNPQACVTFRIDKFDAILVPDNPNNQSGGTKTVKTQADHGFVKGDQLIDTADGYALAIATNEIMAEVVGMVESVIDNDNFLFVTGGEFNSSTLNLIPGKAYFLSHLNAGKLSPTPPPNQIGFIRKCTVIGGHDNNSYFVNFLGTLLGTQGDTTLIDPADFIPKTEKGQAGGVVPLNAQGTIDPEYIVNQDNFKGHYLTFNALLAANPSAQDGNTASIADSTDLTKVIDYVWKNGAWRIKTVSSSGGDGNFLGHYDDLDALQTAHPTAETGNKASIDDPNFTDRVINFVWVGGQWNIDIDVTAAGSIAEVYNALSNESAPQFVLRDASNEALVLPGTLLPENTRIDYTAQETSLDTIVNIVAVNDVDVAIVNIYIPYNLYVHRARIEFYLKATIASDTYFRIHVQTADAAPYTNSHDTGLIKYLTKNKDVVTHDTNNILKAVILLVRNANNDLIDIPSNSVVQFALNNISDPDKDNTGLNYTADLGIDPVQLDGNNIKVDLSDYGTTDEISLISTNNKATLIGVKGATLGGQLATVDIKGAFKQNIEFNIGDGFDGRVTAILPDGSGGYYVGGLFTSYNGVPVGYIVKLDYQGLIDTTFAVGTGFDGQVNDIKDSFDGQLLIAGAFSEFNGTTVSVLVKVGYDGVLDATFNNNIITGGSAVGNRIALQQDSKILVAGNFTTVDGSTQQYLARLNSDGSRDTGFNVGTTIPTALNTVALQSNDKIIIGGTFSTINGVARNRVARLNTDGTHDTTFVIGTGASNSVFDLLIDLTDYIYLVGNFTTYNGTNARRIVRLDPNGARDSTFNTTTGANSNVRSIVFADSLGTSLLIGGDFITYNGESVTRLAFLDLTGELIADKTIAISGSVYRVYSDVGNAKFVAGGDINQIGGVGQNRFGVFYTTEIIQANNSPIEYGSDFKALYTDRTLTDYGALKDATQLKGLIGKLSITAGVLTATINSEQVYDAIIYSPIEYPSGNIEVTSIASDSGLIAEKFYYIKNGNRTIEFNWDGADVTYDFELQPLGYVLAYCKIHNGLLVLQPVLLGDYPRKDEVVSQLYGANATLNNITIDGKLTTISRQLLNNTSFSVLENTKNGLIIGSLITTDSVAITVPANTYIADLDSTTGQEYWLAPNSKYLVFIKIVDVSGVNHYYIHFQRLGDQLLKDTVNYDSTTSTIVVTSLKRYANIYEVVKVGGTSPVGGVYGVTGYTGFAIGRVVYLENKLDAPLRIPSALTHNSISFDIPIDATAQITFDTTTNKIRLLAMTSLGTSSGGGITQQQSVLNSLIF